LEQLAAGVARREAQHGDGGAPARQRIGEASGGIGSHDASVAGAKGRQEAGAQQCQGRKLREGGHHRACCRGAL